MTVPAEKPKKVVLKKIAIVVHQEQSRPGRVGALLEKRGYELHRLCPNLGCDLPEDMSDYAGVVIFGGPMSANDCGTLAGIKCELDWIPKVVEAGVPYLGLCLGAQLLTRAARRPRRPPSRGQGRDGLCRHRADRSRPRLVQGTDEGLPVASRGHGRSPTAASCWPPTTPIPCRPSAAAPTPSASSSIPR